MDRLSSCYFCGGALDVSLSEYPVVPKELQSGDEGPTVVLCPTCRRKLGGVIETVVAATDGPGSGTDAGESADASAFEFEAEETDAGDSDAPDDPGETSDLRTPSEGHPAADAGASPDPGETSDLRTPSEGEPEAGEVSTDLGEEAAEAKPTMTRLEYNKVMRLLQNRPFPVDRGEIREVATSAYDIAPEEFDAVVDAAVERDLIAVENGQFVAPE